jgi:serine protease AprX
MKNIKKANCVLSAAIAVALSSTSAIAGVGLSVQNAAPIKAVPAPAAVVAPTVIAAPAAVVAPASTSVVVEKETKALTTYIANPNTVALIGPKLQTMMPTLSGKAKVVVSTYEHSEIQHVMGALNVPYLSLTTLPMAGAALTKMQIEQLAANERVKSIYYDAELKYYNFTSGEITKGHLVHDTMGLTGAGTTIAVLDSGIDATHPDLTFGEKTIQNVKIAGDADLAGGTHMFLDGQPNTDTDSGHGTHVAGTVAGTGEASRYDERRGFYHDGIAPGATLVGIGAGQAVAVLYTAAGFDYAIANSDRYSIDVITNSWGSSVSGGDFDPNNPTNQASYAAYKKGIVVTFAAGNDGPGDNSLNPYAIAPWVINVAAGDSDRELKDFSSRGVEGDWIKTPDITAPGSFIISTRALTTPLGAAGPITDDLDHPEYNAHYMTMSGTSMATPFVAGVVGVLLEANPKLSPDQIENIIKASADAMPGYKPHQVGAGHINVKAAVDLAKITVGERSRFLSGDTDWSRQGLWLASNEDSDLINFTGSWDSITSELSSEGSYTETETENAKFAFNFTGDSVKIKYVASNENGHAEVFVDGQKEGIIDYYSKTEAANTFSVRDLNPNLEHSVVLRHVDGTINFDGVELSGILVASDSSVENTKSDFSGKIGLSAENMESNDYEIEVLENTTLISATLSWSGVADLDFDLVDPTGTVMTSGATLENPEVISFRPTTAGAYQLRVNGYASVSTDYVIEATVSNTYAN